MKKQRKPIVTYTLNTLLLYGYTIIFSVAAFIFLMDKIPAWVQIIIGPLFLAPSVIMFFITGRREGEAVYKSYTAGTLTTIHNKEAIRIPLYKSLYHVIGYGVPLIVLAILASATRVAWVRGIVAFIEMPITVFFVGTGALDLNLGVGWEVVYIYVPFILVMCAVFCAGYVFAVYKLKRQQAEIESELRSFDN